MSSVTNANAGIKKRNARGLWALATAAACIVTLCAAGTALADPSNPPTTIKPEAGHFHSVKLKPVFESNNSASDLRYFFCRGDATESMDTCASGDSKSGFVVDPKTSERTTVTLPTIFNEGNWWVLVQSGTYDSSTSRFTPTSNSVATQFVIGSIGNDADNTMWGSTSADSIYGAGGNDTLHGDRGADKLFGDAGDDIILGDQGADRGLSGGAGNDRIYGGGGNDRLRGGSGSDLLSGTSGSDNLNGGPGSDTLKGGKKNDFIKDTSGKDRFAGGDDDDVINSQDKSWKNRRKRDYVDCGAGNDTAYVDFRDTVINCENVERKYF